MALDRAKASRAVRRVTRGGTFYYTYYFDCSVCGAEINSQHNYLKSHSGKCQSCSRKGKPFGPAYNSLLHNQHAVRLKVKLTYKQFYDLCLIPDCHYCGTPINRNLGRGQPGYKGYFLDRKNNDLPYQKDNCVPCCWRCNQTKGNRFTYEQFLKIGKLIRRFDKESHKEA